MDQSGDDIFMTRLLPLFPEKWQKNFEPKKINCEWEKMTNQQIADLLGGLHKPPQRRWGPGAMQKWLDSKNNKNVGTNFMVYWRRTKDPGGKFDIFEREILPLMPEKLRTTYRPVGYTIRFTDEAESKGQNLDGIEDLDELWQLANDGDLAAFKKLHRALTIECYRQLPNLEIDEKTIERVIHMHSNKGNILGHCLISIRKINLKRKIEILIEGEVDYAHIKSRRQGLQLNIVEDNLIEMLDG